MLSESVSTGAYRSGPRAGLHSAPEIWRLAEVRGAHGVALPMDCIGELGRDYSPIVISAHWSTVRLFRNSIMLGSIFDG
jgi:hypothetical protein